MAAQDYEQVTYSGPDGAQFGKAATEKIGFYGATPVVQPSGASQSAVATTAITAVPTTAITTVATTAITAVPTTAVTTAVTTGATSTSPYGYATAEQADAVIAAVNSLIARGALIETAVNSLITRGAAIETAANSLIARGALIETAANSLITQSAADVVLVNQVRSDLVTLGLVKGSA